MNQVDEIISALIEDEEFSVKDVSLPDGVLLGYIVQGLITLSGNVSRDNSHYVHESSTDFNLGVDYNFPDEWSSEQRLAVEQEIETATNELEGEIKELMRSWNHKIYRELEAAYEDSISDDVISDSADASDWHFDEDGNEAEAGLTFDQLSPEAKDNFRYQYDQRHNDTEWWSEQVKLEWRWLLNNKGFEDVEIAFSGFSSQGDGASFTAKRFNAQNYFTGPDPLTFPETEREQLSEGIEDFDVKDVAYPLSPDEVAAMVKALLKRANVRRLRITPGVLVKTDRSVRGEIKGTKAEAEQQINMALTRLPPLPSYKINVWTDNLVLGNWTPGARRKFAVNINSMLSMQEAEQSDKDDLKDVSGPPPERKRRPITDIKTNADYAEYKQRVKEFFEVEGITNLSSMSDEGGNPITNEFSHNRCDCCNRALAGSRTKCNGYNPSTGEIQEYWICTDCEYYAAFGQLDDMTMMDMKEDPAGQPPIEERYAGAKQEVLIYYHGTSSKLLPKILSQGLVPDPKQRAWDKDETSIISPSRKSLVGIYVTTNLGTATGAALRVAQRDKAHQLIVVMELQARSLVADEDYVGYTTGIADHLADSAYHHIWPYFWELYSGQFKDTEDRYYGNAMDKQKLDWVSRAFKRMTFDLSKKGINPELERRVKELLFNEGFRLMLARNIAHISKAPSSWDLGHYKSEWTKGFGEYGTEPPLPDKEKAENDWLAFKDKLARSLKDKARPFKMDSYSDNVNGRLLQPVGFTGTNHIICIIEEMRANTEQYHTVMLVHYGKPPEKFIKDWTAAIGPLDKPGDITYKNQVQEAESHGDALQRTGFWGTAGAGGIFIAQDTGRILIGKRSQHVQEPNTWGVFGGAIDEGQSPQQSAEREMREETGYRGQLRLVPLYVYSKGTFRYHNFAALVEREFEPVLNWENSAFEWVEFGQWPQPLHFGLAELIEHSDRIIQYLTQQKNESQNWFYEVRDWNECRSLNYRLTEDGPSVGGHTFPKALTGDDLKLIAETQIRVFKEAGRFESGSWKDVWEWLKTARMEME